MTTATTERLLDNASAKQLERLGFCRHCHEPFKNGDTVIYRSHRRHYHALCWDRMFVDGPDLDEEEEPLIETDTGYCP